MSPENVTPHVSTGRASGIRDRHRGGIPSYWWGVVGAPFGVKGWAHVKSYTDPPDNLLGYAPWQLRSKDDTDDEWRPVDVEGRDACQWLDCAIRPRLRPGCGGRTARQGNRCVAAGVLPVPEVDEYYWRDLIGATVTNPAGEQLGEVQRLFSTPAHDVLVVVDGGGERLIPFVREWVVAVLPGSGQLVVDWEADWR